MKKAFSAALALSVAAVASAQSAVVPPDVNKPVIKDHAMVVSIQHDATDAGVEILKAGGNAVDAAVAVGFALAVTYPQAGNIGGGGFMLIRPGTDKFAGGKPHFLDYREKAPAAASRDMYLDKDGNIIPKMSTVGSKASGVPGTVAGLTFAEEHYGKLGLKRVMQPAIHLAREGFVLSEQEANNFHGSILKNQPESYRIFQRNGNFYKSGELFKQPELAATLQRVADNPSDFYKGQLAEQIDRFERANGGIITAADLAAYECKERTPLIGHYRGLEVLTSPPPSSGGIVLLESLNILEGYDLKKIGADRSPEQIHLITEAFRRAYMDRGDYLGDPDFTTMPLKQMNDPAYAAAWRKTIDPKMATPSKDLVRPTGFMPEPPKQDDKPVHESPQTTHFSVVDADGNAVSSTYTLNFPYGSGITVAGLGFLLNDEMDDFASKMGVPNGFGLIQGPANAIAPGKRPLSSMTPTIVSESESCMTVKLRSKQQVCHPGKLRLVLGSPGGSTIITTVANDLISVVDNSLDIQSAADAPRFHHQYLPDVLQFEKKFPVPVVEAMKLRGYTTKRAAEFDEKSAGQWGDSELIARDPKTGKLMGGHDMRRNYGKADGY
ncbi:gamma-glutamyltransferase [Granulicella cerasi]|uniref:Glutathione hydrolase proenzyme n=1 Tax=Granulicella cerasi TaxID=741063 RepID=A0ABW1Z979_9BACT|nr:gamma-glutamyltransferase [Granulicella cerasi]